MDHRRRKIIWGVIKNVNNGTLVPKEGGGGSSLYPNVHVSVACFSWYLPPLKIITCNVRAVLHSYKVFYTALSLAGMILTQRKGQLDVYIFVWSTLFENTPQKAEERRRNIEGRKSY